MRKFDSPIFAFALLLLALLPATATPQTPQTTLIHQARLIELNFIASSSTFGEHPVTVQVREGIVNTVTLHTPGQAYYQYTIHAQRPVLDSLAPQARKVPNPLVVNIRVDSSDDGKTWMLQTQTNVFTSLGSTLSVEMSDSEKSTRLLLSSRLLPDVTQGRDKAK